MKTQFTNLLLSTGRPNMDTLISNLDKLGFFNAPASTRFHNSKQGGLLEHSMSVYNTALKLREVFISLKPELEKRLPQNSIIIACLLHDICKAEIYVPGIRNVKNKETGVWEQVNIYETDYKLFPAGHGEKSVIRTLAYEVPLTRDEILAIEWHMGAWNLARSREMEACLSEAQNECPLVTLLQCADSISSHLLEK